MKNKKCFKCGEVKSLNKFYKHPQMGDGHLNKCIDCAKKDVALRFSKLLEQDPNFLFKERERGREKYYRLNYREKNKQSYEKKKKAIRIYYEKYPERRNAMLLVWKEIRSGRLTKQPCEVCGKIKAQAHHDDYSKPLDVRWLCIKHHNEWHVKQREQQ